MTTIAECLKAPKGTPVVGLTARVVKAYKPRTGDGQYGPFSVMDMELADSTGKIRASWFDHMVAEPEQIEGQTVTINASENSRGNLVGATVKHGEYQGNKTINLSLTKDHLQLAPASTNGNAQDVPSEEGTSPIESASFRQDQNGRVTVDLYLAIAEKAYRYATKTLKISDEQAAVAFTNTLAIAVTQGRLAQLTEEDLTNLIPF